MLNHAEDLLEDLNVAGRIILKLSLNKWGLRMCSEFIWLKMGSDAMLLCTRQRIIWLCLAGSESVIFSRRFVFHRISSVQARDKCVLACGNSYKTLTGRRREDKHMHRGIKDLKQGIHTH
jgi:hypothetical protein